ncbi:MAG TPA: hypothetical protein VNY55_03580 [Mycobacterium sp.]|jgi:hypothetical protein|nr:hypothetical protein [Mycobacterium sp.]
MTTQAEDHPQTPQLIPRRLLRSGQLHHPAVLDEARRRSEKVQLRLADRITAFAGSMNFVWLHAAFQQSRADHDFETQDLELKTNTELTRQIHVLTEELHRRFIQPA